jgi:23S rRNA (cytidine2498-2'-O)-methyltransferase
LLAELSIARSEARRAGPALVRGQLAPTSRDGGIDLTFARQGFRLLREVEDAHDLATALGGSLAGALAGATAWALSAWVPDHDRTNPLQARASTLEKAVLAQLLANDALARTYVPLMSLPRSGALLAQIALDARDHAFVGTVRTEDALTFAPGGRARMRVGGERPSRAARKIEEALAWLGIMPGIGDLCVDLGAAPGGWSWVLLEKRAKVIAVDPAALRPDVARHRGLRHHRASAFGYVPEEPVDWLFCDMAW